jgi:regulator of sigma E protease
MLELISTGAHYAWSFVVVLSVIVFIHEYGHYLAARMVGVKVDVFSIGFGREIFGWTAKSGTRWKISILPLGGYVKMYGDSSAASTPDKEKMLAMSEEQKRVSFHFKPLWAKAWVVAAGPLANFLLTIAVFTYFMFTVGIASTEPKIGAIIPGSAAASSGLKVGDVITHVDGNVVQVFNDIPAAIVTNTGKPVALSLVRNGKKLEVTITPKLVAEKDALGNPMQRPLIGVKSPQVTYKEIGIFHALGEAVRQTYRLCATSLDVLGQMIAGERSTAELKGPVGIAQLSGQVTQAGNSFGETVHILLWFIALLSANLGMVNLFPIPMLDGGHLVYYGVEALRGRPLAERTMEYGYRAGFVLLMTLMGFSFVNDLRQLWFS